MVRCTSLKVEQVLVTGRLAALWCGGAHALWKSNICSGWPPAGQDVAFLPGGMTTVSINTVNGQSNSMYFTSNWNQTTNTAGPLKIAYDGLTVPLQAAAVPVSKGVPVVLVFAIADVSDSIFDSAVYLQGSSISEGPCALTSRCLPCGMSSHVSRGR